jgi:hypothetical protein
MRNTIKCILMAAAMVVSGQALAHEGEDHGGGKDDHLMGTVESIAGNKLAVKGTDGKTVNVHVDDSTQYEKAGAAGKPADVKVGAKVAIHGEMMKDGTLHATKVRLGKAGAGAPPAPKKDGAPAKKEHADHPKK